MKPFTNSTYFTTFYCLIIIFTIFGTAPAENNTTIDCAPEFSFNLVTRTCVDNETAHRIEKRPSCKNITLSPDFVTIENGRLYVTKSTPNISTVDYFVRGDNSVSLCYPLTPRFRACQRWGVYPNEYELADGGLTLLLTQTNTTISAGDFTVNEAEFGVICIANSASKTYVVDAYATSWIISAASLLASLAIYAVTNRKLSYQTKTMMCHMLSLLVFYSLLVARAWGPEFGPSLCGWFSVAVHYFFLASFFWINVLAFDIWKNLPRFAAKVGVPSRGRFVWMSVYAWGLPGLIATCAAVADWLLADGNVFKPEFARQCWFAGIEAKVVFLYGPAAVVLGSNIVFFGLTVWRLKRLSKDTMMVNKKIHSQLTRMYMKLLVVMGLCWIMEIVSGVVEKDDRYWYFTDIINGLQGFFLFLVYVCKANVLRDLLALWVKHVGNGCALCTQIPPLSPDSVSSISLPNSSSNDKANSIKY